MKFVADESVDGPVVARLRREGHSVLFIAEHSPGIDDEQVLALSVQQQAVLLTADKGFGGLVVRQKQASLGVVLYRLTGYSNEQKSELVCAAIAAHGDVLHESFTVIASGGVRVRKGALRGDPAS